jgi:hypothetical protein
MSIVLHTFSLSSVSYSFILAELGCCPLFELSLLVCFLILCRSIYHCKVTEILALQDHRWSVAGFSLLRPGFALMAVHVGFMVDKVAMGQVFFWDLQFSCIIIISLMLHVHPCVICVWTMGLLVVTVLQRYNLPSWQHHHHHHHHYQQQQQQKYWCCF